MTDRDRLINLLSTAGWNLFTDSSCKGLIVDHLLAHGIGDKAEARKEFAERLKDEQYYSEDLTGMYCTYVVEIESIDNLLREMDGEHNG